MVLLLNLNLVSFVHMYFLQTRSNFAYVSGCKIEFPFGQAEFVKIIPNTEIVFVYR